MPLVSGTAGIIGAGSSLIGSGGAGDVIDAVDGIFGGGGGDEAPDKQNKRIRWASEGARKRVIERLPEIARGKGSVADRMAEAFQLVAQNVVSDEDRIHPKEWDQIRGKGGFPPITDKVSMNKPGSIKAQWISPVIPDGAEIDAPQPSGFFGGGSGESGTGSSVAGAVPKGWKMPAIVAGGVLVLALIFSAIAAQ